MNLGIGGHQSANMKTDEWLTPPHILEALGPFDLDPCAAPEPRPWPTATTMWGKEDDGYNREWFGRVWMNPPYGKFTWQWLAKLARHEQGYALIFARTDTPAFHDGVFRKAHAALFLQGRLHFHRPDGTRAKHNSGAPSVIVAYGEPCGRNLFDCSLPGYCVRTSKWRAGM